MDIDTIKRMIQEFFQEDTVTIVGSGLSLAEGIPGMDGLAKELQIRIPPLLLSPKDIPTWASIENDLSAGMGLEQALHNTKPSETIENAIRDITAHYIGKAEYDVLKEVILGKRVLRFSDYINHFNIRNNGLTIITTNYDRLIEYACEYCDIRIDTLFVGKFLACFRPDESKYMFCNGVSKIGSKQKINFAPKVTIFKPHGCLSWHEVNGEPYSIPNYSLDDCLIITPGLNKYKEGYCVPFDTHRNQANSAIDHAQRYIIIGYGFGDDHLETHLVQQLKYGKPALILTHSLSKKAASLVKSCRNINAMCCENNVDTKLINATEETVITGINLWDLHELLKEVF